MVLPDPDAALVDLSERIDALELVHTERLDVLESRVWNINRMGGAQERLLRERIEALELLVRDRCYDGRYDAEKRPLCTHENYSCVKDRADVTALVKAARRLITMVDPYTAQWWTEPVKAALKQFEGIK